MLIAYLIVVLVARRQQQLLPAWILLHELFFQFEVQFNQVVGHSAKGTVIQVKHPFRLEEQAGSPKKCRS